MTDSNLYFLCSSPVIVRKETQRKIIMYRSEHKAEASLPNKHCFLMLKEIKYKSLTDCNRILIFTSEFSFLPRKISAYLRTDSSSDANTRKIRDYSNILNINNLCLRGISSYCKMHHIGMRNGPYRVPKQAILHSEIGFIALRNGQYQNTERAFPDYVMGYIERRYRQKRDSQCRI